MERFTRSNQKPKTVSTPTAQISTQAESPVLTHREAGLRLIALDDRVLVSAVPLAAVEKGQLDTEVVDNPCPSFEDRFDSIERAMSGLWTMDQDRVNLREVPINEPGLFDFGHSSLAINADITVTVNAGVHESLLTSVLIVMDTTLNNYPILLDNVTSQIQGQYKVLLIGSSENGFERITDYLRDQNGPQQLHVFSHGSSGAIQLGQSRIDIDWLNANNSMVSKWQSSLTADADILIYGCDVARGAAGRQFVSDLAELAGADVAASSDVSGGLLYGGNWDLEFVAGSIEASALIGSDELTGWSGWLPIPIDDPASNTQETSAADRGSQRAVAVHSDGSFVIVWTDDSRDGSNSGVFAQRFAANGTVISPSFQVNQFSSGDQEWASIDMDASGRFEITWTSQNQDGSNEGIYARLFAANSTALSNEFLINTTTTSDQENSVVAMGDSGEFVVVWQGNGVGDSQGIFARRFNASGVALGNEFLVNTIIQDVVEPPLAIDDFFVVNEGQGFNSVAGWLASNDQFFDSVPFAASVVTGPSFESVIESSDGTVRYSHFGGETNSDWFTYRIVAANGAVSQAAARITVTPVDDMPVALNDGSFLVLAGENILISASDLMSNDFDVDSPLSGIVITSQPSSGHVAMNSDGNLVFINDPTFAGLVTFQYAVHSGGQASNSATVSLIVATGGGSSSSSGGSTGGDLGNGNLGGSAGPGRAGPTSPPSESVIEAIVPPVSSTGTPGATSGSPINPGETFGPIHSPSTNGINAGIASSVGESFAITERALFHGVSNTNTGYESASSKSELVLLSKSTAPSLKVDLNLTSRLHSSADTIRSGLTETVHYASYLGELSSMLNQIILTNGFHIPVIAPEAASLLTVGYVAWMIRGGVLMTSFITSLPSWQSFDPLPILESSTMNKIDEEDDTSIEQLVEVEDGQMV